MKLQKIDPKWLKRIDDARQNQNCFIKINNEFYKKHGFKRSDEETLITRLFLPLHQKAFILKIKGEIYYALFISRFKVKINNQETPYLSAPINVYKGYNRQRYTLWFINEKGKFTEFTLHYNDILNIKYKEIPFVKYKKILTEFTET